ncbi:MAG: hypothetical protein HC915_01495 [Anaerolineae bacterium]|nr:hypothetical protein [Anaerolineae bacterium]
MSAILRWRGAGWVILGLGLLALGWQMSRAQTALVLEVALPGQIEAGEALEVRISANGGAGETVFASLFNGTRRFEQQFELDENGAAVWSIPPDTLTQAGRSLLILQQGGNSTRYALEVEPLGPAEMQVIASATAFTAYGEADNMLIGVVTDRWGNLLTPLTNIGVNVRYPDGSQADFSMQVSGGVAWRWITSQGGPGRVRILAEAPPRAPAWSFSRCRACPHKSN